MRSLALTIVLSFFTATLIGLGLRLALLPVEPAPAPPDAAEVEPVPFAPPADDAVDDALACDLETAVCEGGDADAPWEQVTIDCE